MRLESKTKCAVLDGTGVLMVNAKFFKLNEFVHESRRDLIPSTNSNTVQPQEWRKPVLYVRVKMAVRGVDQMMLSFPNLRLSIGEPLLPLCTSIYTTIRLKHLHEIQYLILIWRILSGVTLKCITMISVTNSSIS